MWREADAGGRGGWRGSVHDVAAGRRWYLTSAAEVADFIMLALRDPPAAPERPDPHPDA
jgi:hypothetical protein